MSILSDQDILRLVYEKELIIEPFILENVQPSSVDLVLDSYIKRPKTKEKFSIYDGTEVRGAQYEDIRDFKRYALKPGELVLGQISERILIPNGYAAQIHNRNSLARLGLDVSTASYINPGYQGHLPIVIKNQGQNPVELIPYTRICQIVISKTSTHSLRDYSTRADAKYFNEKDSLISLIHEDEEIKNFLSKRGPNTNGLAEFLKNKIEQNSENVLNELTEEQLRYMGL